MAPIEAGGHFEIEDGGRFRNEKKCYQWISCTEFHNLSENITTFPFIEKKSQDDNSAYTIKFKVKTCQILTFDLQV